MDMREIHVVGQHGLFGGRPVGYSLGIDDMVGKARKDGLRVTSTILEHYQDESALQAAKAAVKRGAILVLTGHSLGAADAVETHNMLVELGLTQAALLFIFDPTWNSPAPPVKGRVRAIDFYNVTLSALGHDQLEPAHGFTGTIINVPTPVAHQNVDDWATAHGLFIEELRFLAGRRASAPDYSALLGKAAPSRAPLSSVPASGSAPTENPPG